MDARTTIAKWCARTIAIFVTCEWLLGYLLEVRHVSKIFASPRILSLKGLRPGSTVIKNVIKLQI
jgi:hypothetical protein